MHILSPKQLLTELVSLMYCNISSDLTSSLYMFMSFAQLASYVFKLNYTEITDSRLLFFFQLLYYCNFSNLLFYFSNTMLTYIMFYFLFILLHFIVFFPVFSLIIKKKLHFSVSDSVPYRSLHFLFRKLFDSFLWLFLTPTIEFCMNITDCESFSYIAENRDNANCVIPAYFWFLTVWLIALSFAISMVYLFTNSESSFLDMKSIKMNPTLACFSVILSRFVFVVVFPLIYNKNQTLVYVFLNLIAAIGILDYVIGFPIRNQALSRVYIGLLCCLQTFFLIMALWGIWKVVEQKNLFYLLTILMLFAYKLGANIMKSCYLRVLRSNFEDLSCQAYLLEETVLLLQSIKDNEKNMLLCGIFQHHNRYCKDPKCKLNRKHLQRFEETQLVQEKLKVINEYILQSFQKTIERVSKPGSIHHGLLECYLMKYTSFLTSFNPNPQKAFFELQRIMQKHHNTSSLFQSLKTVLVRTSKQKILMKDKEKTFSNNKLTGNGLDVNVFLSILKEKDDFEREANAVIRLKIAFWEKYKDGLQSYEQIIRELALLAKSIRAFQCKLEALISESSSKSRPLFAYKMLSFLHCVLLNDVNEGLKYEEEVESTRKREFSHEGNALSYLSFFNGNMIPIKVSFLSLKGQILESSKTAKLAEFFKYSKEDLKSLNLLDLMPECLSQYHERFVLWRLNRSKSTASAAGFIDTYAKRKNGFIFPINLFIGYGFEVKDDFVLQGLLSESSENSSLRTVLFDEKGDIKGLNEGFFKFISENKLEVAPNDLLGLNLFSLVPNLQEILEKNEAFKPSTSNFIRNQASNVIIPRNLHEIIEVLRLKHKEENKNREKSSVYTGMTYKSQKSSNKSSKNQSSRSLASESEQRRKLTRSQFLTRFFTNNPHISIQKRSEFEEKNNLKLLYDRDVLNEMINRENSQHYKGYFDIKVNAYSFGEKESHKVRLFCLRIHRVRLLVTNTLMNYAETSKISVSMSQNNLFADVDLPASEIQSGFVHLPPENFASFRHSHNTTERDAQEIRNSNVLQGIPIPDLKDNHDNNENSSNDNNKGSDNNNNNNMNNNNNNNNVIANTDANLLTIENGFLSVRPDKRDEGSKNTIKEAKNEESLKDSLEEEQMKNNLKSPQNNNNTSDNPANQEKLSQKASSISSIKKAFSIYSSIRSIQTDLPSSISRLKVCLSLEIALIIVFCVLIYSFVSNYMTNYYDPLESALENFSLLETSWCGMVFAATELELFLNNLQTIVPGSLNDQIIMETFNRSFETMKQNFNYERDLATRFNYQSLFKGYVIKYTDCTFYQTSNMRFLDVMDLIMGALQDILMQNLGTQSLKTLQSFPINFQYVVDVFDNTIETLTEEFLNSNSSTSTNILTVMLLFVIVLVPFKLFQLRQIVLFFSNLIRLLNIFMRVDQKSALNELLFQKELLENVLKNDKNELLNIYFPEKTINKKYFELPLLLNEDNNNNQKASPKKQAKSRRKKAGGQRFSFRDFKPLSLLKPKTLLFLTFLVVFSLFFFVYFDWTQVNSRINSLIVIHNYFYTFYEMPSHLLVLNLLMFRENMITIPGLEASAEPSQHKANRIATLLSEINQHLIELDAFSPQFPTYLFEVTDNVNSQELNTLVTADICDELFKKGFIDGMEKTKCSTLLNGAFMHGIITVLNQIINTVKQQQELIVTQNDTSVLMTGAALERIRLFIESEENIDMLISEHFFEEINLRIFSYLTSYYTQLIVNEIKSIETMIILFTVAVALASIGVIVYYSRCFSRLYGEVSLCLSLIPYERLINDEQTVFLIKKFGRA